MNKWEQFDYILKCVLPSYKRRCTLSSTTTSNDFMYSEYVRENECIWRLKIGRGGGLYEDIKTISDFCGIYWQHMTYTPDLEIILELRGDREEIKTIFW